MSQIVPTITAENTHVYREQIERVEGFAKRIHIDLMDGEFTPNKSLPIDKVWLPQNAAVDIHVMFQRPEAVLTQLLELQPNLIILPAESEFNFEVVTAQCKAAGVRFGLAILPATTIDSLGDKLNAVDHLLIFSGNLGHQGGSHADLELLSKVVVAQRQNPKLEIGWDGGVDDHNVSQLAEGGVAVINSGGYIHASPQPEKAYHQLASFLI